MKERLAITFAIIGVLCLSTSVMAEDVETTDEIASRYIEDVQEEQPFGDLEKSLQKVDALNEEGKHKEALQLSLMLTVRYWKERLPLLARCAQSLAAMEKWDQCAQAYESIVDAAESDPEVVSATEEYLYDALANLAFLYARSDGSISREGNQDLARAAAKGDAILNSVPDGEFRLLGKEIGWRHPEAALAVASVSDSVSATKDLEKILIVGLQIQLRGLLLRRIVLVN